jgi:Protein of unknown function (DUF2726)
VAVLLSTPDQSTMHLLPILIIFVVIALAIALAAIKALASRQKRTSITNVYYLKDSLFTPAERSFLGVLESLNYNGVKIASKVRLGDIFGIKKGLERGDRQRALNRITSKHVDFLFIQQGDGRPLLGIELDDRSHEAEERAARDSFVDAVFSSAGLPIIHVVAKSSYDPKEIARQIDEAVAKKG